MKKRMRIAVAMVVIMTMVMSLPLTAFAMNESPEGQMQSVGQQELVTPEKETPQTPVNEEKTVIVEEEAPVVTYHMTATQDGTNVIYDYSASQNAEVLQHDQVSVKDSNNGDLNFQIEGYKIVVDASSLTENQTIYLNVADEVFEASFTAVKEEVKEQPTDEDNNQQGETTKADENKEPVEEPVQETPTQEEQNQNETVQGTTADNQEEITEIETEEELVVPEGVAPLKNETAVLQMARMATFSLGAVRTNEAYEYKYTTDGTIIGSDISYSKGVTPAKLRMIVDQQGNQQMKGYCLDLDTTINETTLYARTTIGEADYFESTAQIGSLRAILKNSLPQVTLAYMQSASGVSTLSQNDAIGAAQWAIWARTNADLINAPSAAGTSNMERAAYWLYSLPAVSEPYQSEPISFTIDSYQKDNFVVFDYSKSTSISVLKDKVITVKDGNGNPLAFTDANNKVSVDISGWTTAQTINFSISGKQDLAGDAYFYKPQGGRKASQSMVAWYEGSNPVKGTETFNFSDEGEAELTLTGTKDLVGRHMRDDDQFKFEIKDKEGKTVATGTNNGATITFEPLTYTKAQVGQTFNYYAVEASGGQTKDGVTYDNSQLSFSVYVGYDGEKVTVTPTFENNKGLEFTNCYEAKPVSVDFQAKKYLEGKPLVAGEYQFTLRNADGVAIETVTNAADGSINFTPIEYKEAGTYSYTISEVNSGAEGVTYDSKVYDVTVIVTDDEHGQLYAEVKCDSDEIIFNNNYKGMGEISVTKVFLLNDEGYDINTSFEVGVFTDVDCTQKAQYADGTEVENKTIVLQDGNTNTVTFEGLEYGTYYVAEIGADGTALKEGDVTGRLPQLAFKQEVSYENAKVVLSPEAKISTSTVITNKFYDEKYYMSGKITVTKKVTVNGNPTDAKATYYTALFEDEALTKRITDVKAIVLDGEDCGSVTFENLAIGATYYVAETDVSGNILESGDYNIETVFIENGVIAITAAGSEFESVITNDYGENYWEEEEEDEDSETAKHVQTGDDMNMGIYGALMVVALAAMGVAVCRRRKN